MELANIFLIPLFFLTYESPEDKILAMLCTGVTGVQSDPGFGKDLRGRIGHCVSIEIRIQLMIIYPYHGLTNSYSKALVVSYFHYLKCNFLTTPTSDRQLVGWLFGRSIWWPFCQYFCISEPGFRIRSDIDQIWIRIQPLRTNRTQIQTLCENFPYILLWFL